MDPITHGITGALLGKAFFSKRDHRVAISATVLGAVFPDVDVFFEALSRDPVAIIKYHRNVTHSFVCLPLFAVMLAGFTRWLARRFNLECPKFWMLTLIYAVGIASHIILDGMTSFGTRIWAPISEQRVAWDLLFIIDFTFTSIVLLPQVTAWIYSSREKSRRRAASMWILFTLAAFGAWRIAAAFQAAFHFSIVVAASAIMAILFFLPAIRDWGFGIARSTWCQAGAYVTIAYLFACAVAHHAALRRVVDFADANQIAIVRIGALPIPPSLLEWSDSIRTPAGVYQARFDLRDPDPPAFRFTPDSPPDAFTARALELPDVELYWSFARFPLIRASTENDLHIVDFGENRFVSRQGRSPQPFTYRVVFDAAGNVVEKGWLTDGLFFRNTRKPSPRAAEGTR
jgi:membrane-bound metal-dependent hydrolase YbcI (DUF457 family)